MNRKSFKAPLALAFCLFGLNVTVTANDIEPGKEFYTVIYATSPIVLDGSLAEWSGVPVLADPKFATPKFSGTTNDTPTYVLFEEYNGGTWSGPDDQTSAVQIVYDADNVYFGFVVTDDYHENAANSAWNGDSIQLMIASADRSTEFALYNYALGGVEGSLGDVIVMHERGGAAIADCNCPTEAVITRNATTKRTTYEIKLPKAALGLTALNGGPQFGLGMAINDGDSGPGQGGQKGWGGLGAHAIVFGKTPLETALITLAKGNDIEPGKEFYTALRTTNAIVLNGNLSEWTGAPVLADPKFATPKFSGTTNASPTYVLFEEYNGGTWSGPSDQTSAVQIVYDADNVYFGFVVTDDYHENAANSAWNGDSIQLMIASADRSTEFALYNYALGGVEGATGDVIIMHERGGAANVDCNCPTEAVITRDAVNKKTFYEIKLPAAAVGLTAPLTVGTTFGLGMAINDGDSGAGQGGQKGWGGLGAHSIVFGKTPTETALVTLGTTVVGGDKIFLSAINPDVYLFSFRASDKGTSIVNPASAKLTLDNAVVTLTSQRSGDAVDFVYTPAAPFPSGSAHTYAIEVRDTQGQIVTDQGSFRTITYTKLIPRTYSLPAAVADITLPGFLWRVHQVATGQPNSNSRTEAQLAGTLGDNIADPNAVGVAAGVANPPSPATAPIEFVIPTVINVDRAAGNSGNFQPDDQMPGMPGTAGGTDNVAAEVLTWVNLPAGEITMGVNSDDGFRLSIGGAHPLDVFNAVTVGEFDGSRGAGDTIFTFNVLRAGLYAARLTWENGGGDSRCEWFSVLSDVDATKVLINDTATPGAILAYQAVTSEAVINPYISFISPSAVPRQIEQVSSSLVVRLSNGNPATVDDNSIVLQYDGATVVPTKARQGADITLTYTPAGLQLPGERHTASLTYRDSTAASHTQQWSFYNMENLVLPASPVTGENFNSYPEATSRETTVPPGWVATNYTYRETEGWDLAAVSSDAFLDWVLISTDSVVGIAAETLDNDKTQLINGQPVADWMSGNLLHVASDGRLRNIPDPNGGPNISVGQINFVVSAPFNLSTVANPLLTFSSGARLSGNKEQNTMEYSIDKGTNWLPVIYMRNSSTVRLLPDGSFDAVLMCTEMDTNQIARWPTPGVGPKGGNFGDMIAAPISQALAPYFANRNDGVKARRVEAIRLPQASRQSDVRLRLTHAGSCGWDWGVDNIAFYDVPSTGGGTAPTISIARNAGAVVITFEGTLQEASALTSTTTWSNVAGSSPQTVNNPTGTKFYRAVR